MCRAAVADLLCPAPEGPRARWHRSCTPSRRARQLHHRATLARIRAALASDERALRAEAIDALEILGDVPGPVAALAQLPGEMLTWRLAQTRFDPDDGVRCAVADALAGRDGFAGWLVAHALRRIVEQDESAKVRFRALVGLAATASPHVEDVLRAVVAGDEESFVRGMARTLLLRRGIAVDQPPGDEHGDDVRRVDREPEDVPAAAPARASRSGARTPRRGGTRNHAALPGACRRPGSRGARSRKRRCRRCNRAATSCGAAWCYGNGPPPGSSGQSPGAKG